MRVLEEENARLKKLLAEAMLDNVVSKDLAKKNGDAWREAGSCRPCSCMSRPERASGVQSGRRKPARIALISRQGLMMLRCGATWRRNAAGSAIAAWVIFWRGKV